jgi:hypothetical protein
MLLGEATAGTALEGRERKNSCQLIEAHFYRDDGLISAFRVWLRGSNFAKSHPDLGQIELNLPYFFWV